MTLTSHDVQAEFRQAPNSRVAIDIEQSFESSNRFSGFIDESLGASFVIIEFPLAAYDELKGMADHRERLAEQGLTEAEEAELAGRDGEYVYFTGTQDAPAGPVGKFVLIFKENGLTAMIVANVPETTLQAGTFSRADIETVLATATVKDKAAPAQDLFEFGYLGPFKDSFALAGTTRTYSTSGIQPRSGENRIVEEPMLMVAPSLDNRRVEPKSAAHRTFQGLGGLTSKSVEQESAVRIGGLDGYRITGGVSDESTGGKLAIHLVVLAGDPNGYFVIVGTTPQADKAKFMPEIEKVIESFEPLTQE